MSERGETLFVLRRRHIRKLVLSLAIGVPLWYSPYIFITGQQGNLNAFEVGIFIGSSAAWFMLVTIFLIELAFRVHDLLTRDQEAPVLTIKNPFRNKSKPTGGELSVHANITPGEDK